MFKKTVSIEGDIVTYLRACTITKQVYSVSITLNQYNQLQNKKSYVQNVCSDLSREQREFLISGITPAEWDHMFGNNEGE